MDFKTYGEKGTKTFNKLEEAFSYAEDEDSVEKISFVLPTDEKVVLTKGLLGWEYDPIDSDSLTAEEVEVLEFSLPGKNDNRMFPPGQWNRVISLIKKGLMEKIVDGIGGTPDYFTTAMGKQAIGKFRSRKP